MNFSKSKKGIVTHPVVLFIVGLVLGLAAAYLWVNYTTIANPFCTR